jgi:apolipoprotein D and lipocalin family protein
MTLTGLRATVTAATLALAALLVPATQASAAAPAAPIQPVPRVDLQKYLGTGKQSADLPQFYESFCERDTTATYGRNSDGTVKVTNTCTGPFNTKIVANGAAKVLDAPAGAQLQVSFLNLFGRPIFTGDGPNYVIVGLPADYSWVPIGSPDRTSAYILSRTAALTGARLHAAEQALTRSGYDPCTLTTTKQTGGLTTKGPLC